MKTANWLTVVVTTAWLASLVVRAMVPLAGTAFLAADTAELMILGYWFSANAIHRKNGDA